MIRAVTTMNEAGFKQTGARMMESFRLQWPADVELVVYAEGFEPTQAGVTVRKLPAWLDEFKTRHKSNRRAHGELAGRYDYRLDAVKFAHKVGAVTDAGLAQDQGVLIWLDADTYTHAPVTTEWLAELFPEPSYIAWLDRENNYPECGFVMYRCGHRSHRAIMENYRDLYLTEVVLELRQTHDCIGLQIIIEAMAAAGEIEPPVSLSGDRRWHHPFINGPLGARMDHMKGARKLRGRSDRRDTRRPRSEAYWR